MSRVFATQHIESTTLPAKEVNIGMEETLGVLRKKISSIDDGIPEDSFKICYNKNILTDNSKTLSSYGIFDGATVHVYRDIRPHSQAEPSESITREFSEDDVSKLDLVFRLLSLKKSSFKNTWKKLTPHEFIINLISTVPELNVLNTDVTAITILQHPELLGSLAGPGCGKDFSISQPILAIAILEIATAVNEELEVICLKTINV